MMIILKTEQLIFSFQANILLIYVDLIYKNRYNQTINFGLKGIIKGMSRFLLAVLLVFPVDAAIYAQYNPGAKQM